MGNILDHITEQTRQTQFAASKHNYLEACCKVFDGLSEQVSTEKILERWQYIERNVSAEIETSRYSPQLATSIAEAWVENCRLYHSAVEIGMGTVDSIGLRNLCRREALELYAKQAKI